MTTQGTAPGGGYYFEELSEGMSASYTRDVTAADIQMFADVSGDVNPVHLDAEFAAAHTPFGGPIAHGILTASYISTVVGTMLPGPGAIYVNQSLKFRAPVRDGDTVVAEAEVVKLVPEKRFVELATRVRVAGKVVLEGSATLMVPAKP